jgi:hypothetical protein
MLNRQIDCNGHVLEADAQETGERNGSAELGKKKSSAENAAEQGLGG